jgi:hypothetical protein
VMRDTFFTGTLSLLSAGAYSYQYGITSPASAKACQCVGEKVNRYLSFRIENDPEGAGNKSFHAFRAFSRLLAHLTGSQDVRRCSETSAEIRSYHGR